MKKTQVLEKEVQEYANHVEKKFKKYVKAMGTKKLGNAIETTVVIDDSDIKFMTVGEVRVKTFGLLKTIAADVSKNITPKLRLTSEMCGGDILPELGDSAILFDIPTLIKLSRRTPSELLQCYKALPDKFKLDDIKRLLKKKDDKPYHRNTYQNWINQLKSLGIVELKGKTYYKKSLNIATIEEVLRNEKTKR